MKETEQTDKESTKWGQLHLDFLRDFMYLYIRSRFFQISVLKVPKCTKTILLISEFSWLEIGHNGYQNFKI